MKRIACFCFVTVVLTGDTGTSVRPNAADYDAHQTIREAVIAASILPAAQVARLFSSAVGKKYTVVEIAIYPQSSVQNSGGFDVVALDFALKTGPDDRIYSVTPEQVAWQGKRAPDPSNPSLTGVHMTTEAGIAVGTRTDPVTGRTDHGVATYGGVEVDNRPQSYVLEGKLRGLELQEGQTTRPVSGYLYFAGPKKQKTAALVLEYSRSGERASLSLPAK